ncbi:MAG: DUF418 domain-containing protein [Pseudomonadota bacterium]
MSPERISSLDFMRGIAILGMLVANVPWLVGDSMSRVYDPDTTSVGAWLVQYLVFDQRFMPIFCMLFGASLYLLTSEKQPGPAFSRYYLRRMAILLGIGIAHAYLLWPGDILITYAICGPFLLLSMHRKAWTLITIGIVLKAIDLAFGEWPDLYYASIDHILFAWWVDVGEAPSSIVEAYSGSYWQLFEYNAWRNQFIQWTALPYFRVWNALGLMLVGMGLFRLGVLQGHKSAVFYRRMLMASFALGLPLIVYGVFIRIGMNDTVGPYLGFTGELPLGDLTFRSGCTIVSLAIIALIHLNYGKLAKAVRRPVEAIGRMALTNYIFHSVFFLLIFHTFKLMEFDSLDHDVMLLFVIIVWGIQLTISPLWLNVFRQGPVEAAWRRLCGPSPRSSEATSIH